MSTVGSVADWLQQWAVISPTDNQSNAGRKMDTGEICGIVWYYNNTLWRSSISYAGGP